MNPVATTHSNQTLPQQLARLDLDRLRRYQENLAFYRVSSGSNCRGGTAA